MRHLKGTLVLIILTNNRLLPIIKQNDQYRIVFESEFEFKPEELVAIFDRIVKETGIAKSYIVEM